MNVLRAIRRAESEIIITGEPTKAPVWTKEEDCFLREKLGWLTDAEIGEAIGRTEIAVHLRWSRDLLLPAPSKAPGIVTAHMASKMLGLADRRKPAYWVDKGLLRGRRMPGGRVIRLIRIEDLERFAVNPKNWIYFDPNGVQDARLKRLISLRQHRWGDAWWTTRQVADHHGVSAKDVTRYIAHGKLPGVQSAVRLEARNNGPRRWANWFVLRSDAVKFRFITRDNPKQSFTPAADTWILKARDELGWDFPRIGRSMKRSGEMARLRWRKLKEMRR